MKHRILIGLILFYLFLSQVFAQDTIIVSTDKEGMISAKKQWVDSMLQSMTIEEQIGQLLMIRTYSNKDKSYYSKIEKLIKEYKPGGLCFFQGGPVTQAQLTNRYQAASKTPLFIAMDAEWGLGMRLDSTFSFPFQMTLGGSSNNEIIYEIGKEIGYQLNLMGVHINFAPVVDVNNNAKNPVINSRSFGENINRVADKAIAYMEGLQDQGIIATAKHFPGHGDTDSDSHYTLPVIRHSRERIDRIELYPFRRLIEQKIKAVMVAHLFIPSLDSTPNTPTTLSKKVVSGLLKNQMGFEGLVITDALDMKGVTSYYKPGEIEVKAFQAGNDILLLPQDIKETLNYFKEALDDGTISEEEIAGRCRKILGFKYDAGLYDHKPSDIDSLYVKLTTPENKLLERKVYEQANSVLKNANNLLPLKSLDTLNIASLALGSAEVTPFQQMLSNYASVDHYTAISNLSGKQSDNLLEKLSAYNLVIAGIHNTNIFPTKDFGIRKQHIEILERISDSVKTVLTLFASPYSLDLISLPETFHSIVLAHQDARTSQEIAAQQIMGAIGVSGILPVTGSEQFSAGTSMSLKPIKRLKYTIPEEIGINSSDLNKIDSIVLENIKEKSFPGCQILFARDGKVFYHKSFGYHTYKKGRFVKNTDLYDIASVTKIASTTLSIMQLYDEKKLDIDHKLLWYLPFLNGSNKENIIIREVMAHQAKLKPWIPFYMNTLDEGQPSKLYYSEKLDEDHTIKVADRLYINSAYPFILYDTILFSGLREKREYKYSDLGFILLKEAIENLTNKPLEDYVSDRFYKPLGLQHTSYNPLNNFKLSQIVPTEDDKYFRKQLIHGYVHDPAAAMLGGVSGHAGLFSSANDLAIFMQMLLQDGYYGGKRYLRISTVREFTKQQYPLKENRRGIGFDKPDTMEPDAGPACEGASPRSFGHSGFTGTYVWADPEYNLVYIFLSNRIHPSSNNLKLIKNNTRTEIHQVVYDVISSKATDELTESILGIPSVKPKRSIED